MNIQFLFAPGHIEVNFCPLKWYSLQFDEILIQISDKSIVDEYLSAVKKQLAILWPFAYFLVSSSRFSWLSLAITRVNFRFFLSRTLYLSTKIEKCQFWRIYFFSGARRKSIDRIGLCWESFTAQVNGVVHELRAPRSNIVSLLRHVLNQCLLNLLTKSILLIWYISNNQKWFQNYIIQVRIFQ